MMNISSIDSSPLFGYISPDFDKGSGQAPMAPQDSIDISRFPDMSDAEVESLMEETIQMISDDAAGALSVHSGLDPNRVYALLGLA